MKSEVHLLTVLTGHALEPARCQFGDFDSHFYAITKTRQTVYAVCDDWPRIPLPDLAQFDGLILSGSAAMLDENKAWMRATLDLIAVALDQKKPLLGVCFGHQLLGKACGAKIGPNPGGRANGTRKVTIIDEQDPLFAHLPPTFDAQVSHRDVILEPAPSLKVIGHASHDSCHVIRAGDYAWGVQFHPEWDISISKAYIEARKDILDRELGENTAKRLMSSLRDSSAAASVLQRFVEICQKNK